MPTVGGAMIGALNVPGMQPGPIEQSAIESRPDVLIYTTPVFDVDTEISGAVTLRLYASTSTIDTDFTAKLTTVEADGKSFNLCEGLLRLSGRNFTGKAQPASLGEVYDLVIGVGQTSVVIAKRQRLRLQVSSSNFPQYDRNMNTGTGLASMQRESSLSRRCITIAAGLRIWSCQWRVRELLSERFSSDHEPA